MNCKSVGIIWRVALDSAMANLSFLCFIVYVPSCRHTYKGVCCSSKGVQSFLNSWQWSRFKTVNK